MPESLIVAESFAVQMIGGVACVRAYGRHEARFIASVQKTLGFEPAALQSFLADTRTQIGALTINSFPRIECWRDPQQQDWARFNLLLRPLPQIGKTVEIVATIDNTVSNMSVKGPNIAHYAALSAEHQGEVLLTDTNGFVLETITCAVLWWRGQTLCHVKSVDRVASITEGLLLELARSAGYETEACEARAIDIFAENIEVWAVNALHGIRTATPADPQRLAFFREQYLALATTPASRG